MTEYKPRSKDPLTFRLSGKIGALLGSGLGYLSGFLSGITQNILNELPYLMSNPDIKKILVDSIAYGNKVASEVALVGLGLGFVLTKMYARKIEEVYEEEVYKEEVE